MNTIRLALAVSIVVVVLASACGSGTTGTGDGSASGSVEGREFWSTMVTENGVERSLVDGTRIQLRFDEGQLGASAGCNSMGGGYTIEDSVLIVDEMAMTEIGCDGPRHAQDDFVLSVLGMRPTVTLDGDELVLATETVTINLVDRSVADPDRPIVGTTWTVTGFVDGQAASSFAIDEPGSLVFTDDSTMTGFDGCAPFAASVEVSDGSTGGPVVGDGEVQFGPIDRSTDADCGQDQAYADTFHRLFETAATIEVRGPNLTLTNADGNGVTFRAAQ